MIVALLSWLCLAPVAAMTIIFVIEMAAGLGRSRTVAAYGPPPMVAVIVPAHDEAQGIAATIAALRQDMPDHGRLLVIADNCTDDTAAVARAAGASVIERHDANDRGKGFALAFARDRLAGDPPEVAIVIDADCRISPGGIARLAQVASDTGRPVQAAYLLAPRRSAGPMVQLSGFAFLVKNLVRQRGLARIGAPAILTGSGMAFPWAILKDAPLATGDIVEDLGLGIFLSRIGHPPAFCADVTIWSDPSSAGGTIEQRRRWEQGFIDTARRQALPLLRSGRFGLGWLGLHLLVPPLALLMMLHGGLAALLATAALLGGSAMPLIAQMILLGIALTLIGTAWSRHGRTQMDAATFLRIPFYILWKLPIYLSAFGRRERRWTRTRRD